MALEQAAQESTVPVAQSEVVEQPKVKLTKEQFYFWKTHILEMQLGGFHADKGSMQLNIMQKDMEINRLRAVLFEQKVRNLQEQAKLSEDQYKAAKEQLEKELGLSLTNKAINENTLEVTELEQSK